MITGLDHVVITVEDIRAAMSQFAGLGFAIKYGGIHTEWGTENALIPLADGTYLELLAPRQTSETPRHRLWRRSDGTLRHGGEFAGFAFASTDLAEDTDRARRQGLYLDGPNSAYRVRPDGLIVRWQFAFAERADLPFLIEDITPRRLRVPQPEPGLNRDVSTEIVTVTVDNLASAARAYEQLLLHGPALSAPHVEFETDHARVRLVQGIRGAARTKDIDTAGPRVESVTLAVHDWERVMHSILPTSPPEGETIEIEPRLVGGVRLLLSRAL